MNKTETEVARVAISAAVGMGENEGRCRGMTNYEKIKNMSIGEMVDFLAHNFHHKICCEMRATCYMHIDCNACYTKWLGG